MRTILTLCLLALFFNMNLFSQKVQLKLTFTGQQNAQHINLDSVQVKNITTNGDTSLIWPDTSLTFTFTGVGIPGNESSSAQLQARIIGNTYNSNVLQLFLPQLGNTDLYLYDISGRLMNEYHHNLSQGSHTFNISVSNSINLLNIRWKGQQTTLKLPGSGNSSSPVSIYYNGIDENANTMRPALPLNNFNFHPGDSFKITAYFNANTSILFSAPSTSNDYTLVFTSNTPCGGITSFSYGGQVYNTVEIGNQCWMKENLNIGTMVASIYSGTTSHTECSNNGIIEKFCYLNLPSNCDIYGGLYDWNEMMQYTTTGSGQGICPAGWHIPADAEFQVLADFLGGNTIAGGPLKEAGYTHWFSPNTGATNISGFTALGAGHRFHYGNFGNISGYASFWSSTEINTYQAAFRYLMNTNAELAPFTYIKNYGFSIRCVKN